MKNNLKFDPLKEVLTPDELCERLKLPKSWLYGQTRKTGRNAIPRVKIGKFLRFHLDDISTWINNQN